MTTIRTKFTLALLVMCFLVIGMVGLSARWIIGSEFDDLVIERSMEVFLEGVTGYYRTYGSWEAGQAREPFIDYTRRIRPRDFRRPSPGQQQPGDRPPPPDGRLPPGDRVPPGDFPLGGPPPPFAVVDSDGVALLPLAGLEIGDRISASRLVTGRAIIVDGETVGMAVAMERPILTEVEERYFDAIQNAWMMSMVIAAIVVVPLGVLYGGYVARPIQRLTKAMQSIGAGHLRQSVRVESGDEIGQLSLAFNKMSNDLVATYEELELSRTRLADQAEALRILSRQDALTGLPNRRAFNEMAANLFAQAQRFRHPLTLVLADVDHFKQINDAHSHSVGDQVLVELASLISANIRVVDLMARYGGEEFVFILPETGLNSAAALMEKIRNLVIEHDWTRIADGMTITLSFGLAEWWPDCDVQALLDKADKKLYQAKAGGRNRVCA